MRILSLLSLLLCLCLSQAAQGKTYLFILSGQSNMARMDPALGFTPTIEEGLAPNEAIVVKVAKGGQPIMRWVNTWEPGKGSYPLPVEQRGTLYTELMDAVNKAIEGKHIDCVTFVWMQGERDARSGNDDVYKKNFKTLVSQIEKDLGVADINVVYGRLSDFDPGPKQSENWNHMRDLQVAMAEANPHWDWVNTDDLNAETNDLHYIAEGAYKTFGERLAEKALALVKQYCD